MNSTSKKITCSKKKPNNILKIYMSWNMNLVDVSKNIKATQINPTIGSLIMDWLIKIAAKASKFPFLPLQANPVPMK